MVVFSKASVHDSRLEMRIENVEELTLQVEEKFKVRVPSSLPSRQRKLRWP